MNETAGPTTRNTKTSYEIPISMICQWLKMLREKTNNADIEDALRTAKFLELTDGERDIVGTLRSFYIAEMNGNLKPPPSMRELYENIEDYV